MLLGITIELLDFPPTGIMAEDILGLPAHLAGRMEGWMALEVSVVPRHHRLHGSHLPKLRF